MADTVTTQVLNNGERNLIIKLTNDSDGTGETGVTKVDVSAYNADLVSLLKVEYDIRGMGVALKWDADTDEDIVLLSEGQGCLDFTMSGGVKNDATGANGDILLTTTGQSPGDSYSITLHLKKKYT